VINIKVPPQGIGVALQIQTQHRDPDQGYGRCPFCREQDPLQEP
jgi:hypothetical protein